MNSKEMREQAFRTAQRYLNTARYWRSEYIGSQDDDHATSCTRAMNEYIIRYKTVIWLMWEMGLISYSRLQEVESDMYEELYEIK